MFNKITPEAAGVSSGKILDLIKTMESYRFSTHSIIMARGDDIFLECYYAPFDKDTKHRMYSISKSFTALAIGIAEEEGLLSLDDPFMKYFPEYRNENVKERFEKTTIREMLTMRSCMVDYGVWWGGDDRAAAYFTKPSRQIGGTNFDYDSSGAFLLGCIVEKVTGKPFMEYLKEKIFLEMGLSADAYCLKAPGGHSHSDSGVMCTPRDLLIFARLLMNGGVWRGKRYLNEGFVKAAISKQTDNDLGQDLSLAYNHGYGYLIWKMPRDGFAFLGMAGQLVICDVMTDLVFIINSENMDCEETMKTVLLHELYHYIIPSLGAPLVENEEAFRELEAHTRTTRLVSLEGGVDSEFGSVINGKKYTLEPNKNGISSVSFSFEGEYGVMEYEDENGINRLKFGMGHNEPGLFPGKKRMSEVASKYVDGQYKCTCSAVWCEEKKLHIMAQVIDEYLGKVHIVAAFKDDGVSISMIKHAQRILDNYSGKLVGYL